MKVNPVLFAKAIADETRQKIMSECFCGQLMIKFAPETATTEKLVKVINQ